MVAVFEVIFEVLSELVVWQGDFRVCLVKTIEFFRELELQCYVSLYRGVIYFVRFSPVVLVQ